MNTWQMQKAKTHFSDLVQCAKSDGPQEITAYGRPVAVVISRELFDQLIGNQDNLVDFIRRSPLYGLEEINIERDTSPDRPIEL